ncbi:MAG: hypothetical protein HXY34_03625 [Candidatus Thorarchaeota archaeon]|nr:hypothetical protein [Candidatus Thorarchaeota archaeon]
MSTWFGHTELYLGAAVIVAAGTIAYYTRMKRLGLSTEEKRPFAVLYYIAASYAFFGFVVLNSAYRDVFLSLTFDRTSVWIGVLIEGVLLALAVLLITGQTRRYTAPLTVYALVTWASFYYGVALSIFFLEAVGVVFLVLLLLSVGILFGYVARETKRPTSFAIAAAVFAQIPYVLRFFHSLGEPMDLSMIYPAVLGAGMVIFSFLNTEQDLSLELIGYGASLASPVIAVSLIQWGGVWAEPVVAILVGISSLGAAMATGTAAYLYGRWRKNHSAATLMLIVALSAVASDQLIGTLASRGLVSQINTTYFSMASGMVFMTMFAMTALLAAGWRNTVLVPPILITPAAIYLYLAYPADPWSLTDILTVLGISFILVLVIPVVVFLRAWWLTRTEGGAPYRALSLTLGILLYTVVKAVNLDPVYSYPILTIGIGLFWSGLTGRLDRWLGKAAPGQGSG